MSHERTRKSIVSKIAKQKSEKELLFYKEAMLKYEKYRSSLQNNQLT